MEESTNRGVYVGNLPETTFRADLDNMASEFGDVEHVVFKRQGWAIIIMKTHEAAVDILDAFTDRKYKGSTLSASWAAPKSHFTPIPLDLESRTPLTPVIPQTPPPTTRFVDSQKPKRGVTNHVAPEENKTKELLPIGTQNTNGNYSVLNSRSTIDFLDEDYSDIEDFYAAMFREPKKLVNDVKKPVGVINKIGFTPVTMDFGAATQPEKMQFEVLFHTTSMQATFILDNEFIQTVVCPNFSWTPVSLDKETVYVTINYHNNQKHCASAMMSKSTFCETIIPKIFLSLS